MGNFQNHCIASECTILDALKQINELPGDALVLFILNEANQAIGSLTDGDIRRALVKGVGLEEKVSSIMNKNFAFLAESSRNTVSQIKQFKAKGISLIPFIDNKGHITNLYNLKKLKSLLPIDAVLMAGGKGERLRPLTQNTPKPLLRVGNKSIIDHNVDRLISNGVEYIYVTVNYLKEQLEEHYAAPRNGVAVRCVREPAYLGTIGSIKLVPELHNEVVLVMNSDLFTNINYEDFYLHFYEHDADMSVAAVPYSIAVPYGIMDLEGRNLKGMIEKPTYNYYANGGIYLLKREMLNLIPEGEFFNATDLIAKLISMNKRVIRFPVNGTWIDIGNPQEYQKAQDLVKHIQ